MDNDVYKDKERETLVRELVAEGLSLMREAGEDTPSVPDMQLKEIDKKIADIVQRTTREIANMVCTMVREGEKFD